MRACACVHVRAFLGKTSRSLSSRNVLLFSVSKTSIETDEHQTKLDGKGFALRGHVKLDIGAAIAPCANLAHANSHVKIMLPSHSTRRQKLKKNEPTVRLAAKSAPRWKTTLRYSCWCLLPQEVDYLLMTSFSSHAVWGIKLLLSAGRQSSGKGQVASALFWVDTLTAFAAPLCLFLQTTRTFELQYYRYWFQVRYTESPIQPTPKEMIKYNIDPALPSTVCPVLYSTL